MTTNLPLAQNIYKEHLNIPKLYSESKEKNIISTQSKIFMSDFTQTKNDIEDKLSNFVEEVHSELINQITEFKNLSNNMKSMIVSLEQNVNQKFESIQISINNINSKIDDISNIKQNIKICLGNQTTLLENIHIIQKKLSEFDVVESEITEAAEDEAAEDEAAEDEAAEDEAAEDEAAEEIDMVENTTDEDINSDMNSDIEDIEDIEDMEDMEDIDSEMDELMNEYSAENTD
jgi:hypothetical protein